MTDARPRDLELRTERLLLRPWRDADRAPFAALNADPVVMEHFPSTLSRGESDRMVDRIEATFAAQGLRLWAVEVVDEERFIGFVGLSAPGFEAAFTPCVEVGWRLSHAAWGHGYATEAAGALLQWAFQTLDLNRVQAEADTRNVASARVLEKLGFVREGTLREDCVVDGEVSDSWVFGLIRREWRPA